jgi:hypothetical protein
MTSRCHCTYVLLGTREREAVWRAGRAREVLARGVEDEEVPLGVLAYEDHAQGWCAVGPRSRYSAVRHSPLWKDRDETEDDGVWLVACFYVRARARHAGVTRASSPCGARAASGSSCAATCDRRPSREAGAYEDEAAVGEGGAEPPCGPSAMSRTTASWSAREGKPQSRS